MARETSAGNVSFYLEAVKAHLSQGHKRKKSDFSFSVAEYPVLKDLVLSIEIPQMKREEIEEIAPHIGKIAATGRPEIGAAVPITFQDVVGGPVHKALIDWVKQNREIDTVVTQRGELEPDSEDTFTFAGSQIMLDGTELSYEDGTPIRFSGTLSFWYVKEFFE